MSLLVMLVALGMVFLWPAGHGYRKYDWFKLYIEKAHDFISGQVGMQAMLRFVIILLPIPVALFLMVVLFQSFVLGIMVFLIGVAVLWYTLGVIPQEQDYEPYLSALGRQDQSVLQETAKVLLNEQVPEDIGPLTHQVTGNMFVQSNQQIFAVLFWYLVLGPAGALAYRLVHECQRVEQPEMVGQAARWITWLDYIPARLVSLSFSLMGHFIGVMEILAKYLKANPTLNDMLLTESGLAAVGASLDSNQPITVEWHQESIYLIHRSLIAWLVFVAVMVAVHWLS
jgi:AmpE protein